MAYESFDNKYAKKYCSLKFARLDAIPNFGVSLGVGFMGVMGSGDDMNEDEIPETRDRFQDEIEDYGDPAPFCMRCRHKWAADTDAGDFVSRCWAFPKGIPLVILSGRLMHDRPMRNLGQQNDLVFGERPTGWKPGDYP